MNTFAVVLKHLVLLAASEIRNVCGHERELAGKDFRRLGDATCCHCQFVRGFIISFLGEGFIEQRLEIMELSYEEVTAQRTRVDEATQVRGFLEEFVELRHTL